MLGLFKEPREILHGGYVPRLFLYDRIPLVKVKGFADARLKQLGAIEGKAGWYVKAHEDLDIDLLKPILPRFAHRSIVPELPDLIPQSSWNASLANMLVGSSWKKLTNLIIGGWGGCAECGSSQYLECHELWTYHASAGGLSDNAMQRLERLRCLCRDCHLGQHLGLASVRGRLEKAAIRLATINRITADEIIPYVETIFSKWETRSQFRWDLDLSGVSKYALYLTGSCEQVADDTIKSKGSQGTFFTKIIGTPISTSEDGKRLRLGPPLAECQLEAA